MREERRYNVKPRLYYVYIPAIGAADIDATPTVILKRAMALGSCEIPIRSTNITLVIVFVIPEITAYM